MGIDVDEVGKGGGGDDFGLPAAGLECGDDVLGGERLGCRFLAVSSERIRNCFDKFLYIPNDSITDVAGHFSIQLER